MKWNKKTTLKLIAFGIFCFLAGGVICTQLAKNYVTKIMYEELVTTTAMKTENEAITFYSGETYTFEQVAKGEAGKIEPQTIYYMNNKIRYKNGGLKEAQAIIDSTDFASTWGGSEVFQGDDQKNTHFIGHLNKQFFNVHEAQHILVTDADGKPFLYEVVDVKITNDRAVPIDEKLSYTHSLKSEGRKEKIVLQTCINEDYNFLVYAEIKQL